MRADVALATLGNDFMLDCSSAMSHVNKFSFDWHDVKFGDDGDKLNYLFVYPNIGPNIELVINQI